jgi:hypothetical protein
VFLDHFDTLILKIIFKNKKYYFNIFLNKIFLKNNYIHSLVQITVFRLLKRKFRKCREGLGRGGNNSQEGGKLPPRASFPRLDSRSFKKETTGRSCPAKPCSFTHLSIPSATSFTPLSMTASIIKNQPPKPNLYILP